MELMFGQFHFLLYLCDRKTNLIFKYEYTIPKYGGLDMKKKKSKKKISNEERIRRTIQSQRAIQGYVAIGNIDRNFIVG